MILSGSVLFVLVMGGDRGTKRELIALQSAFKLSFGLFYTFLHFFTLQAPTVAPGATEEVRVCAIDTGW